MLYIRLLACLMLAMVCECQDGQFKVSKVIKRSNGKNILRAKCTYRISETIPGIEFDIQVDAPTSKFKSKKVEEISKSGTTYTVRNIVSVEPKKFSASFSVIYKGLVQPTGSCSPLRKIETSAVPPTAIQTSDFDATIIQTWPDGGLTRMEGICTYAVDKTYQPKTQTFIITFGTTVERFQNWVDTDTYPDGNTGTKFTRTNSNWIHADKLEFKFHASYSGSNKPAVTCGGTLPQYGSSTNPPTTQDPVKTTQGPVETTQGPVKTTTKGPVETTQGPVKTTQGPVGTTDSQQNTFDATIVSTWSDGGLTRLRGKCTYAVDKTYKPKTQTFVITFGTTIERFQNWVDTSNYPDGNTGTKFTRTNSYWIHADKLELEFQASYSGSNKPTVTCGGTLPQYGSSTNPPTTQDPVKTTQGPVETTQGPVKTTTKGPVETTQGPVQTTTKGPVETTNGQRTTTLPPAGQYNYNEVLMKSIWFYRAQRSGDLPDVQNDPVPWRGDSALYDGKDVGRDLTGGWYDAGDWVKFNLPISSSVAILAWGLAEWEDAYKTAGQYNEMLDCIRWPLDYFIKCWDENNQELYGQVGNGGIDHSKMMRPEDMTENNMPRPAYKVTSSGGGSDLAGSMVAAFAAGAIAFEKADPAYSKTLLDNAKSLYKFANQYRAIYTGEIPDANTFYRSSAYTDELVYAPAMLYKATKDQQYLDEAVGNYNAFGFDNNVAWAFDWDDKIMGAKLLLFEATQDTRYKDDIKAFLNNYMNGGVKQTPGGLAWRSQWGSLRYTANAAFISLMAAHHGINVQNNVDWAKSQIHYMLGDNPRKSSYVVGFGNNPPKQPHHKSSVCKPQSADNDVPCGWNEFNNVAVDNYHTLYGALVGGPDANDNYVDLRTDYIMAEVTCDYNAGFQSSIAGLIHFKNK